VTFEESHAQLGIETQWQWSDSAIERTTPLLFGLSSLVTLFGQALYPAGQLPLKQAAWYHKRPATFSDVLAVVRRQLWGNFTFPTSPTDPDVVSVPKQGIALSSDPPGTGRVFSCRIDNQAYNQHEKTSESGPGSPFIVIGQRTSCYLLRGRENYPRRICRMSLVVCLLEFGELHAR
jgi:hypothetical protein